MKITDLLVTAEEVQTGKRLIGYVCGCKSCRTAFPDEKYDHTDTMELVNQDLQEVGHELYAMYLRALCK